LYIKLFQFLIKKKRKFFRKKKFLFKFKIKKWFYKQKQKKNLIKK
jgi:hypothetical protein